MLQALNHDRMQRIATPREGGLAVPRELRLTTVYVAQLLLDAVYEAGH